jgi:hypothetical protein
MTNDETRPNHEIRKDWGVAEDEKFLAAFEAGTWPFEKWHHREHIRVAYLYLCRHPYDVALEKMRSGIKALNVAHKVPERPDRGYHETMTHGWMRLTHHTLCKFGKCESSEVFVDQHAHVFPKDALLSYYTKENIMSQQARREFVEPDLKPLPDGNPNLKHFEPAASPRK